nr:MAG TPA: Formylmethanofuran dehydrogenase subunit-like protein [Caudoviricetes sp.]
MAYFSVKSFPLIPIIFLNRIHLRIHFHNHLCPYS